MCPEFERCTAGPARQAGFGIVSAVFILVFLAILGASIVFLAGTQRNAVVVDVLGSRAYQAARAGIEWGAYQALVGSSCAASTNLAFPAGSSLAPFTATVTCTSTTANEGGSTITLYNIVSNACNVPTGGACPNGASNSATYVERQVTAVVGG
jgi:MSHA biogenesis protein MshP